MGVCLDVYKCDVCICGCAYMCASVKFSYVGVLVSFHEYRGHRRLPGPVLSLSTLFP